MPFISHGELNDLRRSADLLPQVNKRANDLEVECREAEVALDGLRQNYRINERVQTALAQYEDSVVLGDIEPAVIEELVTEGTAQIRSRIAAGLKSSMRDEVFREIQIAEGPAIKDELDQLFQTDGTYAAIQDEVTTELRRSIAADLLADKKKSVEQQIDEPEYKQAYLAENADTLIDEAALASHEAAYLAERELEWKAEAIELLRAQVEHDVLESKPEIIARLQESYSTSKEGKSALEKLRKSIESEISGIATEELLARSGDEHHKQLLIDQAKLAADKLKIKNTAERLALDFTNGGIDTLSIDSGTVVDVLLGSLKTEEERDGRSYNVKQVTKLHLQRKISATAMGDGLFRIDADTLQQSSNQYAARDALQEGVIVKFGMLVRREKEAGAMEELVPTLKAGITLQYDTDTSTPDFTDALLPVADVAVNGVSARKYDKVNEKLL